MAELRSWELFTAVVAGMRASVCGSDSMVFSWTPPIMPAASSDAKAPSTRIVKVCPAARGGSSGFSVLGCLASGLFGAASGGSSALCTRLRVASSVLTPGEPSPLDIRPATMVPVSPGQPSAEDVAAVLAAVWDHSRALWVPLDPATVVLAAGPEQTLPLSTPVSRCFRVCVGLAARLARPVHTVSNTIRSPTGGSAILKSAAFGAGATLVLNMDIGCASITVIGKRETRRAAKAVRTIARNLEVMPQDNGWRRRPSDPEPLKSGALEIALFAAVQAIIEVIEKRE